MSTNAILVTVAVDVWQVIVVVHHEAVGSLQPIRAHISQPVQPPNTGTILQVKVSHWVNRMTTPLYTSQIPAADQKHTSSYGVAVTSWSPNTHYRLQWTLYNNIVRMYL